MADKDESLAGLTIATMGVGAILGFGGTELKSNNPQPPGTTTKVPGSIAGVPTAMILGGLLWAVAQGVSSAKGKAALTGLGGGMLAGGVGSLAHRR